MRTKNKRKADLFMSENMVGTKQAAGILGVSVSTVYRMVEQNILKPTKTPGGQRRFEVSQLQAFKESSIGITAPQNPYMSKKAFAQESDSNITNPKVDDTIAVESGPVDPRNTLNDLNGSQWLPETKSFFFE